MTVAAAEIDINDEVLKGLLASANNLPTLHRKKKEEYFNRNLPFYTCINNNDLWAKELPTGEVYLVVRHYLTASDEIAEKVIKQIK